MAAKLEQYAKRRAEKEPAPAMATVGEIERAESLLSDCGFTREADQALVVEARGEALWDKAVESLGRSADVLEELVESTGEAIARIAARGDRIDRLNAEN